MARLSLPLSLVMVFALVRLIESQCVTSTYVPCYPNDDATGGSGGVPEDDFDDSEFWDTLQGVASAPIGKRDVLRPLLSSRQNALCCPPTNQCLVLTDGNIPFCYVSDAAPALPLPFPFFSKLSLPDSLLPRAHLPLKPKKQDSDTTEYLFSDDSFGFLSNGTYYAADGTFVDFKDGYYSSADGTTGTFAAATAAASSSDIGAAASSTTAQAAPTTTTSQLANPSPKTSSSVGSTKHSIVTAPTSTPSSKSGGVTIVPASAVGWLGLCVAWLGLFGA